MISASTDEPAIVFTRFVRDWFRLLSRNEFAQAVAQLDEPNDYGVIWSEKDICDALSDYGGSRTPVISDPDTVAGDGRPDLVAFGDGSGYSFWHHMPLDGQWGDLTAQFEFLHRPRG